MSDCSTVCSMCGDVGFADKLFRCLRCRSRFQHSYCTNYYYEEPSETAGVCDWCLSERYELPVKKPAAGRDSADQPAAGGRRTAYVKGDKVKQSGRGSSGVGESESHGTSTGGGGGGDNSSSSRPSGRRYKLLKDVLC